MKKRIINIISFFLGIMTGGCFVGNRMSEKLTERDKMSDKHLTLFLMMNQWVRNYQERRELYLFFEKKGYKKIAIYGLSYVGETLLNELKNTDIQVDYAVDRNIGREIEGVKVYSPEDMLENVDAIIVTAIMSFDEIKEKLEEKVTCPIISLEDIIYEI